jgi:hypothetical protein
MRFNEVGKPQKRAYAVRLESLRQLGLVIADRQARPFALALRFIALK